MVVSWSRGDSLGDVLKSFVRVKNSNPSEAIKSYHGESLDYHGTVNLTVLVSADPYPGLEQTVCLELLSANHDQPNGMVETVGGHWNIITRRMSYQDPLSDKSLMHSKRWLQTCTESHAGCASGSSKFPKRIIELTTFTITVKESFEGNLNGHYACLSHCWGPTGPSLQLTALTEPMLRQGINLEKLPRTFLEAAKVCLALDIRYLWIDALCIRQDNIADWEEAAISMASVYENSIFTIAAACSKDSDAGLRPVAARFAITKLKNYDFYVRETISEFWAWGQLLSLTDKWPLLSRAWAFQERRLSPRVIYFSCFQTIWQCQRVRRAEDAQYDDDWDEEDSKTPMFIKEYAHLDTTEAWHQAVSDYSALNLTFPTDRLPAFAAFAQRMGDLRTADMYIAGMWRDSLLLDLMWRLHVIHPRPNNGLPSWTWASTQGHVLYQKPQPLDSAKVVSLDYTVGEFTQPVKNAILRLQGVHLPLLPWTWTEESLTWSRTTIYPCSSTCSSKCTIGVYVDSRSVEDEIPPQSEPKDHTESTTQLHDDQSNELTNTREKPPAYQTSPTYSALLLCRGPISFNGVVLRKQGTVHRRIGWVQISPPRVSNEHVSSAHDQNLLDELSKQISQLPIAILAIT